MTERPPENPLGNDVVTMGWPRCPACGVQFRPRGRRRWCSEACRQMGFRRRHQAPEPPMAPLPKRVPKADVVYQCPQCDARYLGEQRCDECQIFCRRLGPGADCPHCGEPVAVTDLLPLLDAQR